MVQKNKNEYKNTAIESVNDKRILNNSMYDYLIT